MNNFEIAFKAILGFEGTETTNAKSDRGGLTKYGISQKAFPMLDIENLTLSNAKEIYFTHYWKTKNINLELFEEKEAIELFDIAVNMGVATSGRMLQTALNLMNRNQRDWADMKIDGIAGAETMKAYFKCRKDILLKVLNGLQFSRYVTIVESDKEQEQNFNGWMKRV